MANTDRQQVTSPFEGDPLTTSWADAGGNEVITVIIRELTPDRAKSADSLSGLFTVALWFSCFYGMAHYQVSTPYLWIVGLIAPLFVHNPLNRLFRAKLRMRTTVEFTPDRFCVQNKRGVKLYDRTLTHRFLMMKHDQARTEREKHQLQVQRAQMEKKIIAPRRYYDDSFHIVFEYLGQRFDVADVFDQVRATAVTARLKACDKLMDTKFQTSEGEALNPGDQWGEAPGKVPGA